MQPLPQVPEYEQIATAIADRGEAAARGVTNIPAALAQLDAKADALLEKRRWMLEKRYQLPVARSQSGNREPATGNSP